ncbi:MAG: hypothetical protein SGBAC_002424 [Bacillariaceae sp.]
MATQDYWNESIRLNNVGVQYLLQGLLSEAVQCFREAAEYNEAASYEQSSVHGFGVYANQWISLSHTLKAIHQHNGQRIAAMKLLQPAVLSIGKMTKEDDFVSETERRKAVFTSRLDWIIDFNLATSLQLYGILHGSADSGSDCLRKAYEMYDEMSKDVIEWNNYTASVDMAMLLMAICQNQSFICDLCQKDQLVVLFMLRIRHIQQFLGDMPLDQETSISLCKGHCAPVA